MIDLEEKAIAVCRLCELVMGGTVLLGYPNAIVADGPYTTVYATGDDQFGQAMKTQGDSGIDIADGTHTQKIIQFSINTYREGAASRIGAIKEANKRFPVQALLREAGLGWCRVGPVQNLTALESGNYEQRYQCNLYLYAEDSVTDVVNRVYQVEYGASVGPVTVEGDVNGLSG